MWIDRSMPGKVILLGLCLVSSGNTHARFYDLSGERPKVLFIGNSITAGWETHFPALFKDGYWFNRGIGGQTTSQLLGRFERDLLTTNPDVVVLMGGTNDIAGLGGPTTVDSIFNHIASMVALAQQHGVGVVLCSVLPAHEFYCCPGVQPVPMIRALNNKLRRLSKQRKLVYADYYPLLVDHRKGIGKGWSEDGVHPNKAGYARMLPLTEDSILKAWRKRTRKLAGASYWPLQAHRRPYSRPVTW